MWFLNRELINLKRIPHKHNFISLKQTVNLDRRVTAVQNRSQAQNALKSLNHNGSGRINVQELQQHLADANCPLDQARVKQFIASHEVAQDGTVDLQQLSKFLDQQ
ncbi:hypothetical protein P879_04718 [Paragonimus westermani]|uniref:EF-hand domain-containing protein n=1 Tax=Paragonimus westermani TaxID=34504 RepID=A0A8T0DMM9_9TREM|nr:hypothetical protein P879_04718 [Paragonimus westermani]